MALHQLRRVQLVSATIADCWGFFSNPENLSKITPPALDFRIITELPPAIRPGLLIEYRVRPLFGIPMTWVSEITQVSAPHLFIDEQRIGPYALWHHEHSFRDLGEGRTEITDLVQYAPPYGILGELLHPWLIAPALAEILEFRERAVRERFEA